MESNILVICPNCNEIQHETIHELVDSGDMDGNFKHSCQSCKEEFTVQFEYIPVVRTYLEEDEQ